jgi:hypothetical protein
MALPTRYAGDLHASSTKRSLWWQLAGLQTHVAQREANAHWYTTVSLQCGFIRLKCCFWGC